MESFILSIIIGLAIAAPVGPIGILCVKSCIESGVKGGLRIGLGAAVADLTFGILAVLGLSNLLQTYDVIVMPMRVIGAFFIAYLGGLFFYSGLDSKKNRLENGERKSVSMVGAFLLTLSNPMTILGFTSIFAGISQPSEGFAFLLPLGIFIGSMIWWAILSVLISGFNKKFNLIRFLKRIELVSGLLLIFISISMLYKLVV